MRVTFTAMLILLNIIRTGTGSGTIQAGFGAFIQVKGVKKGRFV